MLPSASTLKESILRQYYMHVFKIVGWDLTLEHLSVVPSLTGSLMAKFQPMSFFVDKHPNLRWNCEY